MQPNNVADGEGAIAVTGVEDVGFGGVCVGGSGTDSAGGSISSNFLCISSIKARMSQQSTLASLMVSMDHGCREQMQHWVVLVGFVGEYEKKSIQSGHQGDKNKLVMGNVIGLKALIPNDKVGLGIARRTCFVP